MDTLPLPPAYLDHDRACIQCSYNLRGLPEGGVCPECGTPIFKTLRGHLLSYASPDYLSSLLSGTAFIIASLIAEFVCAFLPIFATIAAIQMGLTQNAIHSIIAILGLIPAALAIVGYWKFTRPDPGFVGSETPRAARRVLRASVIVIAATIPATALFNALGTHWQLLLQGALHTPGGSASLPAQDVAMAVADAAVVVVRFAAWVVQFFAAMLYIPWIAGRIPDRGIISQTRVYIWLLPLLYTVGRLLICLGPLAALIIYIILMFMLRARVAAVRRTAALHAAPASPPDSSPSPHADFTQAP